MAITAREDALHCLSLQVPEAPALLSSFSVGQEGAGRNKRSALRRAFMRILRGMTRPCPSDHPVNRGNRQYPALGAPLVRPTPCYFPRNVFG